MGEKKFGLAGVVGWPVAHSRSPLLHNHWIRQYGLQGSYVLLPVAPGSSVPRCPILRVPARRRILPTTSCEVQSRGLSTMITPST